MSSFIDILRQIIPLQFRRIFFHRYYKLNKLKNNLIWQTNPRRLLSLFRLYKMKNRYHGQRCFIIGNGPSINKMDIGLLKNEFTIGLNRIYLLFPKIGFTTTFHVAVNKLVIEQCAHEIEKLPMTKFISWHARKSINFTPDMIFVRDPYSGSRLGFSKYPSSRIWEGATVTYVAMQIAFYLGFSQVILIGVDHNFTTKGEPHKTVISEGPDPNHFSPDYFNKGFHWQLPDLETSEQAYRLAKQYFEQDGREILDATVGGKLDVFPKVDYQSLFK